MRIDPVLTIILSDLFVNLAAGWLGAAFIIPIASKPPKQISIFLLTINMGLAILFLIAAFILRKLL